MAKLIKLNHFKLDLTNKRFGKLLVKSFEPLYLKIGLNYRTVSQWKCECDCGKITLVKTPLLRNGKTKSCGCLKHTPSKKYKGCGDLSGSYWYMIKINAYRRDLEFSITIEEAWNLFLKQNRKCALSSIPLIFVRNYRDYKTLQTASLDRIDPTKGYTIDNVQWLHKDINNMKQAIPQVDFINYCNLISKNLLMKMK